MHLFRLNSPLRLSLAVSPALALDSCTEFAARVVLYVVVMVLPLVWALLQPATAEPISTIAINTLKVLMLVRFICVSPVPIVSIFGWLGIHDQRDVEIAVAASEFVKEVFLFAVVAGCDW